MNDLISVIVPVYNSEKYIERCLDSLRRQTYSKLEVIIVNDGSTDGSATICEEFAKQDVRFKLYHKENGGLSSARNYGVKKSLGEYIGFVDSDDYVEPQMYKTLLEELISKQADLAICGMSYIYENGEYVMDYARCSVENELLDTDAAYKKLNSQNVAYWYYVTAQNKLYKREIVEAVPFLVGKIHEDEFAIQNIFEKCNRIVTIQSELYKYIRHNNSIVTSEFSLKKMDAVDAFMSRYEYFYGTTNHQVSKSALLSAYYFLLRIMTDKTNKKYKSDIYPWIKRVTLQMIHEKDIRFLKLGLVYLLY